MRRWLTRILICLLLGAVTTVGVAWGCGLRGVELCGPWNLSTPRFVAKDQLDLSHLVLTCKRSSVGHSRCATILGVIDGPPRMESVKFDEHDLGIPMRSLSTVIVTGSSGLHVLNGFSLDESGGSVIALRPIWPGFLIDTLFYGVMWFGLLFGFGAIRAARRALRTRRGLCPMCAYDLRGCNEPGCPECGWNRTEAEE